MEAYVLGCDLVDSAYWINGIVSKVYSFVETISQIRGHMIHQFLEDPLVLLSTIKDDDHLVAYKIPKNVKNTIYLQFVHRHEV